MFRLCGRFAEDLDLGGEFITHGMGDTVGDKQGNMTSRLVFHIITKWPGVEFWRASEHSPNAWIPLVTR
jgi:hypothetical protein